MIEENVPELVATSPLASVSVDSCDNTNHAPRYLNEPVFCIPSHFRYRSMGGPYSEDDPISERPGAGTRGVWLTSSAIALNTSWTGPRILNHECGTPISEAEGCFIFALWPYEIMVSLWNLQGCFQWTCPKASRQQIMPFAHAAQLPAWTRSIRSGRRHG